MRKRLGSLFLGVVLAFSALVNPVVAVEPATAVSPVVNLSVDKAAGAVGDTFTLTVSVTSGVDVYGAVADVVFDPSALQVMGITGGTLVHSGVNPDQVFVLNTGQTLSTTEFRQSAGLLRLGQIAGANGDGAIATITFRWLKGASAVFSLGGNVEVELVNSSTTLIPFTAGVASVTVSSDVPRPQITVPQNNSFVNTKNVGVGGTGAPGASLAVYLDSTPMTGSQTVGGSGSFGFPLNNLSEGPHTVRVVDQSTGTSSDTVTFTVDTIAPQLQVDPLPAGANPTLTGRVTDANMLSLLLELFVPGQPAASELLTLTTDGSFAKTLNLAEGATYSLKLSATDKAGNRSTSSLVGGTLVRMATAQSTVGVGSTFVVDVMVENVASLAGVTLNMVFDPAKLEVVDADSSTTTIEIGHGDVFAGKSSFFSEPNSADNTAGTIAYTGLVTNSSQAVTTTLTTLARVTFMAKATGTLTTVGFSATEPSVLGMPGGIAIPVAEWRPIMLNIVEGGWVSGRVLLDGKTDHAGTLVEVLASGGQVVASGTTDSAGDFRIVVSSMGTFEVRIDREGWSFVKKTNIAVTAGSTVSIPSLTLYRGDMNKDSYINVLDLLWMAEAIGKRPGQTGWKPAADINGDTYINVLDLLAVAPNIGKRP